jgi:hypothetical protein
VFTVLANIVLCPFSHTLVINSTSLYVLVQDVSLLGQIAQTDFVLEPFRNPPTMFQIRACMGNLFDLHADRKRRLQSQKRRLMIGKDSENLSNNMEGKHKLK